METNNPTTPTTVEKDRNTLIIDSFLHMLLAGEWDYRADAAVQRLIRGASFRYKACLEQTDYTIPRGLDRDRMERLASLEFIRQGQNLFITDPSGTGKSFLATAMGYEACEKGIRAVLCECPETYGYAQGSKIKRYTGIGHGSYYTYGSPNGVNRGKCPEDGGIQRKTN